MIVRHFKAWLSTPNRQRGNITILWALMLPVIIGFVALGLENSLWYVRKDDMQSATDAAAIATAFALGGLTPLQTVANNEMTRNGYGPGQGVTVTVNNPPASGTYAGNVLAVELIATQSQTTMFAKVVYSGTTILKTRAVALSTAGAAASNACFLALDTTNPNITINGSNTINIPGCVMASNSSDSWSVNNTGSSTINLKNIYTVGGIHTFGTINNTSPNVTGAAATPDPFASLPMPAGSPYTCGFTNYTVANATATMNPGVYCGTTRFGNSTGTATANVTMNPGTYIFKGDFIINGSTINVTGSNVTLIFTNNAGLNINAGNATTTITLSAPTMGTYSGIVIYSDRANSESNPLNTIIINGGAKTNLTGVIYAPTSWNVTYNGNPTSGSCTRLITTNITINGKVTFASSCPTLPVIPVGAITPSTSKLKE